MPGLFTRASAKLAAMTQIIERTIMFADLRGSTALYETLGDGLMATFDTAQAGVQASMQMHDALERLVKRGSSHGASSGLRSLRLQVALARGEVVEMGGDCFGDAVNVAARLLDHAGDNETLITAEVLAGLPADLRARFRSLDRVHLRGRVEPVQVHLLGGRRSENSVATQFGDFAPAPEPEGIRLVWNDLNRIYAGPHLPVVLGRSPQATYCIDDSRVSRSHARIDWHGSTFQLTDLSYNGTYVRFSGGDDVLSLRRGSCTLHGQGVIGLGGSPQDPGSAVVRFEVLSFVDTVPHTL